MIIKKHGSSTKLDFKLKVQPVAQEVERVGWFAGSIPGSS